MGVLLQPLGAGAQATRDEYAKTARTDVAPELAKTNLPGDAFVGLIVGTVHLLLPVNYALIVASSSAGWAPLVACQVSDHFCKCHRCGPPEDGWVCTFD